MHRSALHDPEIPPDAKIQIRRNVPQHARLVDPTEWKKHTFVVTYPTMLLLGSAPSPPKNEKYCINILHSKAYVSHRSHRMQKHKLEMSCPYVLLLGAEPGPREPEK
jgi:hypothetical protein